MSPSSKSPGDSRLDFSHLSIRALLQIYKSHPEPWMLRVRELTFRQYAKDRNGNPVRNAQGAIVSKPGTKNLNLDQAMRESKQPFFTNPVDEFAATSELCMSVLRTALARAQGLEQCSRVVANHHSRGSHNAAKQALTDVKRMLHGTSSMLFLTSKATNKMLQEIDSVSKHVSDLAAANATSLRLIMMPDNVVERIFLHLEPSADVMQPEYLPFFSGQTPARDARSKARHFLNRRTLAFAQTCTRFYALYKQSYVTALTVDARLRSVANQMRYREVIKGGLARYPRASLLEVRNSTGVERGLFRRCACDEDQLVTDVPRKVQTALDARLATLSAALLAGAPPGRARDVSHLAFVGTDVRAVWEPTYCKFADVWDFDADSAHWFQSFTHLKGLFTNTTITGAGKLNALVLASSTNAATLERLFYAEYDPSPTNQFHSDDSDFGKAPGEVSALASLTRLEHLRLDFCEELVGFPGALAALPRLRALKMRTLCMEPVDVAAVFAHAPPALATVDMDMRCYVTEPARARRRAQGWVETAVFSFDDPCLVLSRGEPRERGGVRRDALADRYVWSG